MVDREQSSNPDTSAVDSPVTALKGVGPSLAGKLSRLGIETIQSLLFHLPHRYVDRTRISAIGGLQPNQDAVIEAEVKAASVVFGRRRSLMVKVQDRTGVATLRFFHFSKAQQEQFQSGRTVRCFGEVRLGRAGLEIYHPEYRFKNSGSESELLENHLTPIYPATEGLTQQRLRQLTRAALTWLAGREPPNLLPPTLLDDSIAPANKASRREMLSYLHFPPADAPVELLNEGRHPFQQQLIFEELLAHQLSLLRVREKIKRRSAPPLAAATLETTGGKGSLADQFVQQLQFELTDAQARVITEIAQDLQQPHPMLRLLQGDVGSGKTVVAAMSAINALQAGYQVAVMAPTEILAEQHLNNFQAWFQPLGIKTVKLTRKTKGKAREAVCELIRNGSAQLIVGTHALFQKDVDFLQLGFVIIDEQHRFGVDQRLSLQAKGVQPGTGQQNFPHQLVMTATPIPRTLAMSYYSNLDVSVIDELPPGRKPVTTSLVSDQRRNDVIERLREQCGAGHQAYWVCTLNEESEELEAQAAEATANELSVQLPELHIGLIHGRLKPAQKSAVMDAFKGGEIDLLVATTVIEVGVDVANASFMIIENPERLGLAQLHQLRGRVGRGNRESHCILLYHAPLSDSGQKRLAAMRQTQNGFEIAEIDLRLRGPGELLGARQSGELQFHLADLQRDAHLLKPAKQCAQEMIVHHPENVEPLIERWIPSGDHYGHA